MYLWLRYKIIQVAKTKHIYVYLHLYIFVHSYLHIIAQTRTISFCARKNLPYSLRVGYGFASADGVCRFVCHSKWVTHVATRFHFTIAYTSHHTIYKTSPTRYTYLRTRNKAMYIMNIS